MNRHPGPRLPTRPAMKPSILLVLLLGLAPLRAETPAAPPEGPAWEQAFAGLPSAERRSFAKHVKRARQLIEQERVFEALDTLRDARAIFPDSPEVENLIGACQIEFDAHDKAMARFRRALELSPGNPRILFNIADIQFATEKWEPAIETLETLLGGKSPDPREKPMRRLAEFKLLLAKLRLGRIDEARAMAGTYDFRDDSPFSYYAKAALAYHDDEDIRAKEAVARARRIFRDPALLAAWSDPLDAVISHDGFLGRDFRNAAAAE